MYNPAYVQSMTHKKSVHSKSKSMKKRKLSLVQERRRSKSHYFKSEDDSKWLIRVCGRPDRITSQKSSSTNLLAKESGKSRQRHKDVKAVLLSASEPACDPQPNAFDYINYCESGGASGTECAAIHNAGPPQSNASGSGYLWRKTHKQCTFHNSHDTFRYTFPSVSPD